jgi:hypothetical protein
MFKTDNIQSQSEREEEVCCCAQSAYTERLNPLFIEEETPLPSSDKGTHKQEGAHLSLL